MHESRRHGTKTNLITLTLFKKGYEILYLCTGVNNNVSSVDDDDDGRRGRGEPTAQRE